MPTKNKATKPVVKRPSKPVKKSKPIVKNETSDVDEKAPGYETSEQARLRLLKENEDSTESGK